MDGYIKLRRRLLLNATVMRSSAHLAVWVYLLLEANFTDGETLFGGRRVRLKAGQLITGRRKLAEALNLSESTVERILRLFEVEQQISQIKTTNGRLITILNWARYQALAPPAEPEVNNGWTASGQRTNTSIRRKEEKEQEETRENARAREEGLDCKDTYGEFGLVRLSSGEYAKLQKRLGQASGDAERLEELLAAEREKHGFSKSGADGGAAEPAGGGLPGEGSAPGAGSGAQPEPILARLAREFVELKAACPEVGAVADLPDAVLADAAKTGRNLLDSLLRYRWNEARKAEAAAKSRQAAAGRSTGSLSAPAESPVQAAAEAMVRGVWS